MPSSFVGNKIVHGSRMIQSTYVIKNSFDIFCTEKLLQIHKNTFQQGVQGLKAFAFCLVIAKMLELSCLIFLITVNDEHMKLRFKRKRRG